MCPNPNLPLFDKGFALWKKDRFCIGGSLLKNSHAKAKRVFNRKLPLHVILRSSKAHGPQSMLHCNQKIERILNSEARRFSIELKQIANAGNHIHLLISAPSRIQLSNFLRAISGIIARIITGAKKGKATLGDSERFWDARPFSRIVSLGRDYKNVWRYLAQNTLESICGLPRPSARAMISEIAILVKKQKTYRPWFCITKIHSNFTAHET